MNSTWDSIHFFETLIANYSGSKYAVAVDSCSHAIFLALKYCKYQNFRHEMVNVPKQTYVSVPMQVFHSGYKINFVDLRWEKCYRLDPLPIIDSAQKFEKDMYIKNTYYCLSFHSKKTLPIGKGGMILTDDYAAYTWFKSMRHDGRDLTNLDHKDISYIGYHMYMQPEQAIRGIELFYGNSSKQSNHLVSYADYSDISSLTCFKSI
jgi:dTDP-4-amino-4,6-dideoxygalactose transaminase